jgi:hypothetical protein
MPGFRSYLLDCRAYELVTPEYKGGFPIVLNGISGGGTQLYSISYGVFSHPEDTGTGFGGSYQITRTSLGWESLPFDASFSMFPSFDVEKVSPDFTSSIWFATTPSQTMIPGIYTSASLHGPFTYVGPGGPTSAGQRVLSLVGASRDLSHSVYSVEAPGAGKNLLWPGDKTARAEQRSLYEYAGASNMEPRLVGISNIGPTNSIAAENLISECGTSLGGPVPSGGGQIANAYNAISESGSTIFFTALGADYLGCSELNSSVVRPQVNELYARLDGSQADAHTVAISEPSAVDCGECKLSGQADARFWGASFDGSRVFFTTTQQLLPGSSAGAGLYEYDFNGPPHGRIKLVSLGDPEGARVQRVVRVSNDGSHVYFIARGVLTDSANVFGAYADEEAENLYVYERDGEFPQGHIAFIGVGGVGSAQDTPDGRFLIFESTADLTPDEEGRIEAGQVFEYDAQTRAMVRVSQSEGGYNDNGNSDIYAATIPGQGLRSSFPIEKLNRLAVSANGAYVFFTSEDGLTLGALTGVANVYEYHEGRVGLVSDGRDLAHAFNVPAVALLGTDESGRDVFFETADQLVPQDTDTQLDVYDARIEGGFSAMSAGGTCAEDACQGAMGAGLQSAASPTSLASGEGPLQVASGAPAKKGKPSAKRSKKKAKRRLKSHRRGVKKATRKVSRA